MLSNSFSGCLSAKVFLWEHRRIFQKGVRAVCMRSKSVNLRDTTYYWLQLNPCLNTVDSRYLEVEATLWNTSRYPYFDISDFQNLGKYK